MDFSLTPLAKLALCGFASLLLLVLIFAQILAGASFPVVRFRASERRAYWTVVGAYCIALLMVVSALVRCR